MLRSLEIGKRALLLSQRGLDVTSNNIANVNTPGYARQMLMTRPGEAIPVGGDRLGMGVLSAGIRHFRDQLLDRDLRAYTSRLSYYQQDDALLQRIEAALGEPGEITIQTALQNFFDAASTLATNPASMSNRQLFVARAADLASTFNRTGSALEQLRTSSFERLTSNVSRVNQLLSALAETNQRIAGTLNTSGTPDSSLVDRQSQLLDELSRYVDITVRREPTGTATVISKGAMLVSENTALTLAVTRSLDSTSGETTIGLTLQKNDGTSVGSFSPASGELASLVHHYNVTLNPLTTSNEFSIARELDKLASTFAEHVNTIAATGFGLNDTGSSPPGRAIFASTSSGPIRATTLSVLPALVADPALVPTSSQAGTPGNNDIIRAIADVASDGAFLDSLTPEGYYASITTRLAELGARTTDKVATTKTVLDQVTNEREAFGGVNLDEEATNLITYQRAFEAAARVISVTSDMLATLVNLGR